MRIGQTEVEDNEHRINKNINKTRTEKDIGVVIDDKLSFSEHLAVKINNTISLVYCVGDKKVFCPLALVRPHLEYANPVWCPYPVKDNEAVENVQRRKT